MKRNFLISGFLLVCVTLTTNVYGTYTFDRYRIILDRKPFGDAPPPQAEPAPAPPPPGESFAKMIRMSAIVEKDDGTIKVGIVDQKTKRDYMLEVGEIIEGIELISADYEDEEAVLRKGSEMAVIKLTSGEIQALSPDQQQQRLDRAEQRKSRPSYAERRRARMERRNKPPPEPKYEGEELKKHLQEYQMEVIRQGLPPLPIPLTPEMDDTLVEEGILPPAQ